MRAAEFNRRCSIEYKSVEQEATYGTEIVTWIRLAEVWAQVRDVLPSRSESVRTGVDLARNQVRIRMRWRADLDSSMRIVVHGGNDLIYQIVGGPAEVGRQEALEMVCERWTS